MLDNVSPQDIQPDFIEACLTGDIAFLETAIQKQKTSLLYSSIYFGFKQACQTVLYQNSSPKNQAALQSVIFLLNHKDAKDYLSLTTISGSLIEAIQYKNLEMLDILFSVPQLKDYIKKEKLLDWAIENLINSSIDTAQIDFLKKLVQRFNMNELVSNFRKKLTASRTINQQAQTEILDLLRISAQVRKDKVLLEQVIKRKSTISVLPEKPLKI